MHLPPRPQPYVWNDESVEHFWSLIGLSPLTEIAFSKMMAHYLVRIIHDVCTPPCSILDFGAGDGDLAAALLDAGYRVGVYDPSVGRTNNIVERPLIDHTNFLGFFGPDSQERFDMVCAFEVLEHILPERLAKDMKLLRSFLKTNSDGGHPGILLGSVPNNEILDRVLCVCPNCATMFHRFQHMRSFDAKKLKFFLAENGFSYNITVAPYHQSLLFVAGCENNIEIISVDKKISEQINYFNEREKTVYYYYKQLEIQKNNMPFYEQNKDIMFFFTSKNYLVGCLRSLIKLFIKIRHRK